MTLTNGGRKVIKTAAIASFALVLAIFAAGYIFVGIQLHSKKTMSFIVLRPAIGANRFYNTDLVPNVTRQSLFVQAVDGSKLHVWFYKRPDADMVAIVSHGNAGNISNRIYLANALTKAGCSVLLYDYRGYGLSTGHCSIDGIIQDGLTIYDFVHDQLGYPASKIVLYGESIGTAVTCDIASIRGGAGVILQSGISSLPSVARHLFPMLWLYPNFIFCQPHLDNVVAVEKIHVPILIVHGKVDRIVPFAESEYLFEHANQPKEVVFLPSCGHNDMGVLDTAVFNNSIQRFVATLHQ